VIAGTAGVPPANAPQARGSRCALICGPDAPRKRSGSRVATNTAPRGQSEAVRAWAKQQGMRVSTRGRMPSSVISAYLEAHDD